MITFLKNLLYLKILIQWMKIRWKKCFKRKGSTLQDTQASSKWNMNLYSDERQHLCCHQGHNDIRESIVLSVTLDQIKLPKSGVTLSK